MISLPIPSIGQEWEITIAFGRSKSPYFERALYLARKAPVHIDGGDIVQSTFPATPHEFLIFSHLFDIVKGWKSLYIAINGEHTDIRLADKIIWCYSERCRSGCMDYCYGNDTLTENPFGCHRLNFTTYSCPWWIYGEMDTAGVWHADKEKILLQLQTFADTYKICPAFSPEAMTHGYLSIPDTINPAIDPLWKYDGPAGIIPASRVPWRP